MNWINEFIMFIKFIRFTISNSTEFKAGDISNFLNGFEVLNPELVICHL